MQTPLASQVFYEKTESGHREALGGRLAITRPVRNLLLVINATQPLTYWLSNVRGVSADAVLWLEQHGLVIDVSHVRAQGQSPEAVAERQVWMQGLGLIEQASPVVLRETMRKAAWATLKGLRAYNFVEELQSCQDDQEIRQAARCLLSQIWSEHGVRVLRQVIGTLSGSPAPTLPGGTAADGAAVPVAVTAAVAAPATLPGVPVETPARPSVVSPAKAQARAPVAGYRLARWPGPQWLKDPRQVRLATLLMVRTVSQAQLAVMSRCEPAYVRDFLSVLLAQPGLLQVLSRMPEASVVDEGHERQRTPINHAVMISPSEPESHRQKNIESRQTRHETLGLLGRLRNRLGLH